MELRHYAASVILAALVTGIIASLVNSTALKSYVQILSGLYLAITILSPFLNLDISKRLKTFSWISQEATESTEAGKDMARNASAEIIKQKSEAYILNKAAAMDVELSVSVTVRNEGMPVPSFVAVCGNVSPGHQAKLERIICNDLGISKENQSWNG